MSGGLIKDLRQTEELKKQFAEFGVKTGSPTFIMTECLLCYMSNDEAKKILSAINSMLTGDVIILNYEMIHPNDPFGKVMIANLEVRFVSKLTIVG